MKRKFNWMLIAAAVFMAVSLFEVVGWQLPSSGAERAAANVPPTADDLLY